MFSQESALSFPSNNICGSVLYTNKRTYGGLCTPFFWDFLVNDWVTMSHKITCTTVTIWCIFGAYFTVKIKLSNYSSLNFLEKTKLCYILFYTGKIRWTFFFRWSLEQVSHFCLLYDNTRIGVLALFCFWDFSLTMRKQRWVPKRCRIGSCSSASFRDIIKKMKKRQ